MIRAGIIGCGRIADQHAIEIQKMQDCQIVGACDTEEFMAMQLSERFGFKNYFSDIHEFLDTARPNTVHITTPPQSHFELGKLCLEADCNVMFEKPFALNTLEVEELIDAAQRKNLKITVDHNMQFNHTALKMREIITSGFLGGPPVHVESIWCYSYGDPGYAKALLGEKNHWVRNLPGKLLHNIISHGVSKIAEFLYGERPEIMASGYTSAFLNNLNEKDIFDELRVIIRDSRLTTAYFTFSTQISPPIHELRIFGPKNSLIIDDLHQTVIKVTGHFKSYLNHYVPAMVDAKQYAANSLANIKRFIKRESYFEEGRRNLIQRFYNSILYGEPVPIPYKEIILTSRIMDDIFQQLDLQKKIGRTQE
jgi:predicted dehydrogenase